MFAGPEAVLEYLSRYTHRVAISNSRLISYDEQGVTFKWKDYRDKGRCHAKTMTLDTDELMRRFLIHVLPSGFHRIRHYGLFANAVRADNLIKVRKLLECEVSPAPDDEPSDDKKPEPIFVCPACAAPMIIIEVFDRSHKPRAPPTATGS